MAVSTVPYDAFLKAQLDAPIDFNASPALKVALLGASYTPNRATHDFFNDLTNEIVDSTGDYAAGGQALTTIVTGLDTSAHFGYVDCDDPAWTNVTATPAPRYAVIYKDTGTGSTSPLIGYIDLGSAQTLSGQDFSLFIADPSVGGLIKLTGVVAP